MPNFRSRIVVIGFGLALLAALAVPVIAQIDIGSLSGVVTDPQGGVIQGAQVTAVETSTHATHLAVSDSDGVYVVLSLPSGTYDLTISHPGFQTLTNQKISLGSGENKKVDAKLLVGKVSETVEVTGTAPALETREGAYSTGESIQTLEQLPLEVSGGKRNPIMYLTALPGYQTGAQFQNQINGSVAGYNELYVDGTPLEINAAYHGMEFSSYGAEGVDELKVVTTPMADLGNVGGAAISFIMKSGTNQLHGSGYGFIRNTLFDANCDQFCPGPKPVDHQGEYGFQVGGPLYIPHVYDGRNKTFWWFNWDHFFYNFTVGESFYGVPTDAMKGGDFSSFLGSQIGTDPLGNPVYQGEIYNPDTTTTVGNQVVRTPYTVGGQLNMVPTTAFSRIASKYQTIFPEPNVAGASPGANNYGVSGGAGSYPDSVWQLDIDQNIGNNDRLAGTFWDDQEPVYPVLQLPPLLEVWAQSGSAAHSAHLSWTHTFSSHLVEEASLGIDRTNFPSYTSGPANSGAAFLGQPNPLGPCTPSLGIAGGYMTSNRSSDALCDEGQGNNNFAINDNWSLSKGRHLIKWGFNLIRFNANFPRVNNLYAGFRAAETSLPDSTNCPTCAANTGSPYASFLIGAVDNGETQGMVEADPRILEYGFYAQDEFKITRKLTLTYALRYDLQPFPVDRHNAVSQFEATEPNPGCNGCPGAVAFLGFGAGTLNERSAVPNQFFATNFGPKFGFAYQIQNRTVIRGAVTLADAPVNQTAAGFANELQQGYFPFFSIASPDGISPAFQLDNGYPFPPGISLSTNFNPAVANGGGTGYFGKDSDRAPRVLNTTLNLEHEFPGRVVVGLHYNGAYAHGIITGTGQPANQLNYGEYASYGTACLTSNIAAQTGCPAVVPLPYASFTGTVEQALRPYPQYQDIENQSAPTGWSTYSGGQITAKKDFDNGLSFLVGYTLSREFSNLNNTPGFFSAPAQDAYNPKVEKAPAYADMPNNLVFNYTYQLPIGRGKRLNVNGRALDAVVGGWSIAGIHNYQSGTPLSVGSETVLFSMPVTSSTSNSVRPNVVSGQAIRTNVSCSSFNPAGGNAAIASTYLNPAAFVMPGPLQFGDAPRAFGNARSCPYYNESMTFFKNFRLSEKVNMKFGADFFNLFNRHQWAAPNTDVQSPDFGKIFGLNNSPRQIQFNARVSF